MTGDEADELLGPLACQAADALAAAAPPLTEQVRIELAVLLRNPAGPVGLAADAA